VYRLEVEPDVGSASFSGTVSIDIVIHEAVTEIVLNAAELAISDVEVRTAEGEVVGCTVTFDDVLEQASFHPPAELPPGPCVLSCRSTGTLNDKLRGFYRSTFTDAEGQSHTIATTQLESVDARRAFPCWDEPDRKAVFDITLIVERNLEAISNSPIADVERSGEKKRVHFSPTMKMSTYLVAFIVGNLETTDTVDVDGVPLRVVFTSGKRGLTDFAMDIGAFSLRFFAEYFDIPYPAEKVDLIAIPDFAAGAMENLGAITFRDTALLVDPVVASRAELERVAEVVSHEMAHMWFGDLVTMGWWEGIWLNEAFATFMAALCVDAFRPAWETWVGFAASREAALDIDGVHATRPIEYPVGLPREAEGMFDLLTYEKGCAVLRMLEQYIGAGVFRSGIRTYLKRHAYGNTVTNDLWDALEEASGSPVRDIMNTFILQGGHPLISLSGQMVHQDPFSFGPVPEGTTSSIGSDWNVPLAVRALGVDDAPRGPTAKFILGADPAELPEVGPGLTVINAGGWGVFRTNYERDHLLALAAHLGELDALERANLMADTWATTRAGRSTLEEFLILASQLGLETDPAAWAPVASALSLTNRIVAEADREALRKTIGALFGPIHGLLGFDAQEGEAARTPTLRAMAISMLGDIGADPGVQAEAATLFDASPTGGGTGAPISADVASAVLAVVTQLMRPGDYELLLKQYREAATPQEEVRTLQALTTFPDVTLAQRTFDLAMTEVRTQNGYFVIAGLLNNRFTGQATWLRLTEQWDEVLARFSKNVHTRLVEPIASLCGDPDFAQGAVAFLREHPIPSGPLRVAQAIERLNVQIAFGERERDRLGGAFRAVLELDR